VSVSVQKGFPPVPENEADEQEHRRKIARAVNRINGGKFNATGSITLRANQTTTTLTDSRIYATSFIWLMPTTANAKTALANVYFTNLLKGSATINHSSSANTDQSFTYLVIG
jgi:hypothetical protein